MINIYDPISIREDLNDALGRAIGRKRWSSVEYNYDTKVITLKRIRQKPSPNGDLYEVLMQRQYKSWKALYNYLRK